MISRQSFGDLFLVQRLADVVEFLDSRRRPITESDRRAGPFPYYGANGVQGTIDDFIFDEPLVLLAEDGGHFGEVDRGIAYRISGKTWVNNHAHVLRPTDKIDIGYLCRVLENYDVSPFVTGTTRGKLTKAGASRIEIPLPPLAEQRRIAEVLDRAEALRAKRRAALAQLDALTQSLFLDLFGDPKSNSKKWPQVAMSELFAASPIFGTMIPPVTDRLGWLSLRVGNIQNWALDLSDSKYVELPPSSMERHSVKDGDLLLARAIASQDHLGKCVIAHPNGEQWAFDSHLMRLRFDPKKAEPEFIRHLFMTPGGRALFLKVTRKSTVQYNINTKEIAGLKIPLPPLPLQQTFARRVAGVERLKAAQRASLAELDALFATLQHRAFRGEL